MNYRQFEKLQRHLHQLKKIFPATSALEDDVLRHKLVRLERRANLLATRYCNGDVDQDDFEDSKTFVMQQVDKLLQYKAAKVPVFFNQDPRGYSLTTIWRSDSGLPKDSLPPVTALMQRITCMLSFLMRLKHGYSITL